MLYGKYYSNTMAWLLFILLFSCASADQIRYDAKKNRDFKVLFEMLHDASNNMKIEIADSIVEIADSSALQQLIDASYDENDEVRLRIAQSLCGLENSKDSPRIHELLKDNNMRVRGHAIMGLMRHLKPSDKKIISDIESNLSETNWELRLISAEALIQVGNDAGHEIVRNALNESFFMTKQEAIRVLGLFKDPKDIVLLKPYLTDNNSASKKYAKESIERITGQKLAVDEYMGSSASVMNDLKFASPSTRESNKTPSDTSPAIQSTTANPAQLNLSAYFSKTNVASTPSTIVSDVDDIPNFIKANRDNDVAVIIGIENYQNVPKSDFAVNDARIIKDYLIALGFQERNVTLLIDERATLSSIRKSFEAWLPNVTKKDSKVFIYYSGHGVPSLKGKGYILPFDGDPNYIDITGYPVDTIFDHITKLEAKEIMIAMDSCFSGGGGKSVLPTGARPIIVEVSTPLLLSDKVVLLSSSHANQISTSFPEKKHGLFTYYFLRAIRDGYKSFPDIYNQIKPQIENEARRMNIEQSPAIYPDGVSINKGILR